MKKILLLGSGELGKEFVKMEMGIPGLPAAKVGVEAQMKALGNGIANVFG